ncbi:MAG: response regulator transcription factor [Verrucomicrobia bacterium]|nr:response regulator transcription factor [Verrucomicrobiota bacterium]
MNTSTTNQTEIQAQKKVFVVDDHPIFRDGLVRIVEQMPDLVVCGESDNAVQALDEISKLNPDLLLVDIGLPGMSGLELMQNVHAIKPKLPVLVISMHDESLYAMRVLRAGGRGYIMKQAGPEKIMQAITTVMSGRIFATERTATLALDSLTHTDSTGSHGGVGKFTNRELEVFRLTGQGKDNHQIAKELNVTLKTVDTHRGNIKDKLGLKSNTEVIHYAVRWTADQS